MRLDAAIATATERLAHSSDSARLDAEILLCRTIDMPRSYLFAHPDDELDDLSQGRFETLLTRREAGEPMAYIMGTREFWTHELHVSPATLVPRPETELLVDLALREIPRKAEWRVLDLGTGSGAIAIAIAGERPLCELTATDVSAEALKVAMENARAANLPNIEFIEGRWTAPLHEQEFDVIISNPPYVREDDEALADLRHEPLSALASGPDGLNDIRELAASCGDILAADGWLMLEHGYDQQQAVADIMASEGWTGIACHNDLAGLPRVTVARRGGKQARTNNT
jgi:release factor glutamine methyltransferase